MTITSENNVDNHCPFCHGHKDHELIWHELAETHVCLGCRHEINCGLDYDEQPTTDNYNCYDTIERLLQRLGISYAELQQRHQKLDFPNDHVEESRMQSNGSTHYIYANVSSWSYAYDQLNPSEVGCGSTPSLHLDTMTEQCEILQAPMPLGLCIVHDDKDFNWKPPMLPWQLDLIYAQEEPQIPRCLEAVIILAELPFRNIKESLFLTAKSTAASVQVKLAIQEKISAQPDDVSERSFAIVEFGYTLNYQKESK